MAKFLISFVEGAMQVSEDELPEVVKAAHAVVDEAKDAGVWILGGGLKNHSEATVVTPERTLIDGPEPSANGALAGFALIEVRTYEEALDLINASPFGNGTAIFTRDGGAARRFQLEVEAGMVGVNVPIPVPVGYHSFGGWKDSLFGDHHIYGNDGTHFYTRGKVVTTRWPDPADAPTGVDLGFPRNH